MELCSSIKETIKGRRPHYVRALRVLPHYPDALNNLGVVRLKLNNPTGARQAFRHLVRAAPNHPRARLNLGFLLVNEPRGADEAITLAKETIHRDPKNARAYGLLGVAYAKKRQFKDAYLNHRKAIRMAPRNAPLRYNLACAFSLQRKATEAVVNLALAIQMQESLRQEAQKDKDFDPIRDNARFRAIVHSKGKAGSGTSARDKG